MSSTFGTSNKLDAYETMQVREAAETRGPNAKFSSAGSDRLMKSTIDKLVRGGMIELVETRHGGEWKQNLYKFTAAGIARCTALGWIATYEKIQAEINASYPDVVERAPARANKFMEELNARVESDKLVVAAEIAKAKVR